MRTKKPFVPPYIYKLLFYSFRFFASILQLKHCVKICSVLATEFPLMAGEVDCFSTSSLSLFLFFPLALALCSFLFASLLYSRAFLFFPPPFLPRPRSQSLRGLRSLLLPIFIVFLGVSLPLSSYILVGVFLCVLLLVHSASL